MIFHQGLRIRERRHASRRRAVSMERSRRHGGNSLTKQTLVRPARLEHQDRAHEAVVAG